MMLKHRTRLFAAAVGLAAAAVLASAGAAGASAGPQARSGTVPVLRVTRPAPAGVTPRALGAVPLRVPDPAVYAAQKAAADAAAARRAGRPSPPAPVTVLAPALVRNWAGQRDTTVAPSDSTGAIGTTRYVELVNARAAIYNRASNTPTAAGALLQLTGCATAGCTDNVFDPQVIWDPGTSRFFYAADDIVSSTQNLLDIGFSTTATPTLSASSWCRGDDILAGGREHHAGPGFPFLHGPGHGLRLRGGGDDLAAQPPVGAQPGIQRGAVGAGSSARTHRSG
jgi:hypothetical protein